MRCAKCNGVCGIVVLKSITAVFAPRTPHGSVMERLGIIAGGGPLPVLAAREARMQGVKVVAVALEEAASPTLANEVDAICWVGAGQLGRLISAL